MFPHFKTVEELAEMLAPEQPVYCFRPGVVAEQARAFLTRFPGRVMFAVKSNPHPAMLEWLHDAGIRDFDTAERWSLFEDVSQRPGAFTCTR